MEVTQRGDETLGLVDFSICPHLAPDGMPGNSMAEAEAWAATIDGPAYAMDDETAISVVDGKVEVVSEGPVEAALGVASCLPARGARRRSGHAVPLLPPRPSWLDAAAEPDGGAAEVGTSPCGRGPRG